MKKERKYFMIKSIAPSPISPSFKKLIFNKGESTFVNALPYPHDRERYKQSADENHYANIIISRDKVEIEDLTKSEKTVFEIKDRIPFCTYSAIKFEVEKDGKRDKYSIPNFFNLCSGLDPYTCYARNSYRMIDDMRVLYAKDIADFIKEKAIIDEEEKAEAFENDITDWMQ